MLWQALTTCARYPGAYNRAHTQDRGQEHLSATLLIDSLVRSLQVGSLYALMAIGLTLTLAVMRLPNFAHSELITIGAYVALVISTWVSPGLPLILFFSFVVSAALALLTHRTVYRPWAGSIHPCTP